MLLPSPTDALILDDGDLLRDRLLRSLHRNRDGHLAASARRHADQVSPMHNIAVLFVYTTHGAAYSMHEHYIFSHDARPYRDWLRLVYAELDKLQRLDDGTLHGVYGWMTSVMRITPLRTGDLFIKIDSSGATGVRISFSAAKDKRETRSKKTKAAR